MWEAEAPGRQAASSGGQDFVSRWLLVLLVESGAGVRAALASAPWEGALDGFLLVLALLPAPCLPPEKSQAGFGLELQQEEAPGPGLGDLPGAPGPPGPTGATPTEARSGQGRLQGVEAVSFPYPHPSCPLPSHFLLSFSHCI